MEAIMKYVVMGMFAIPFIFMIGIGFVMFNGKLRSKVVGHQMKISKQVLEDNEDVLEGVSTKTAEIGAAGTTIRAKAMKDGFFGKNVDLGSTLEKNFGSVLDAQKRIYETRGADIEDLQTRAAELGAKGTKIKGQAFGEGFHNRGEAKTESNMFCKHCGELIDSDSKFCNMCGKTV